MIKKTIFLSLLGLILIVAGFFFIGSPPQAENILWGVNFSQTQAVALGLDWRNAYTALIDDLGAKNIKLATYWNLIEKQPGEYDFSDVDWQIQRAEDSGVSLLLAIGMKTPRWPECHIPEWAKGQSKADQQTAILDFLRQIVTRYDHSPAITMWQVENEPFFPFGECPWVDKEFLKEEVALVKSLDIGHRPVVVTDSGEGSLWLQAAKIGDIAGTTMYKKVWVRQLKMYFTYFFPPTYYWRKAEIVKRLFDKEVICVELQAEPWVPGLISDSSLAEQQKSMNLERLQKNIEFAKKTGLKQFYLWGSEWWYWLKEKQNDPAVWQEMGKIF